jgi:hypothetical protein
MALKGMTLSLLAGFSACRTVIWKKWGGIQKTVNVDNDLCGVVAGSTQWLSARLMIWIVHKIPYWSLS